MPFSDNHSPSVMIPMAFANIDEKRVRNAFEAAGFGRIIRIDAIHREVPRYVKQHGADGPRTKREGTELRHRYFVHLEWAEGKEDIRQALLDEKEVRMTYDKQWYWKLKASTYKTKEQLNDERAAAKVSVTITDAPVSSKDDDDDDQ